jgi:hypothetical protein
VAVGGGLTPPGNGGDDGIGSLCVCGGKSVKTSNDYGVWKMATERNVSFKSEKIVYSAKIMYETQEEILDCANRFVVWNLQRLAREGKLPKDRTFTCNWKGEPVLTEEEKVRQLIAGLTPERAMLIQRILSEKLGGSVPQEMVAVEGVGTEKEVEKEVEEEEEAEPDDLDMRIAKYIKWDLKKLRAKCEEYDIDHEEMTREEMAEEIAMNE